MTKIKRNDPCPCGSGKKFKKCCLDKPNIPKSDNLNEAMQKGYSYLEKNMTIETCDIWLDIWEKLKHRFTPDIKSITDAEKTFSGLQCLFNWCQDLEMELGNASLEKSSYYKKRIKYCREFCTLFPKSDENVLVNMRRSEAESYFAIGDIVQGENIFRTLIKKFPKNEWAYIGWGDMYFIPLTDKMSKDYTKAEQIYKMALSENVNNIQYVNERLKKLQSEKLRLKQKDSMAL